MHGIECRLFFRNYCIIFIGCLHLQAESKMTSSSFFLNFKSSFVQCYSQSPQPEGVFLGIIKTKILRLLLHAIHSHLHQLFFSPPTPNVLLDLRFLQLQLKVGGDLALFTLSLYRPQADYFGFPHSLLLQKWVTCSYTSTSAAWGAY